jgi:3D (Asp-Asp-Asp) domain-containing protein
MQKFSDSSKMKSQKLKKTTLKSNVKKISIGAVLLAVGISSYAVIASDDSMVTSKGRGVSVAAAGNTLYADNAADYEEATATERLADGTLSDVNKTGTVALSSKKSTKQTASISGGVQESTTEAEVEPLEEMAADVAYTDPIDIEAADTDADNSATGLPDEQITEDPSTEKSTEGLPEEKIMYVNGATSGTYLGTFWVTAYCPCPICCGEYSNMVNPTTASGAPAVEGVTCAAPSNFEFGTELIVDGHTYTVQDRGGAINGNHLDIYFSNHQAALNFATGYYEVYAK